MPGGTVVYALNADPPTLNSSWSVGQTHMVACKIMEGLVSVSPDRSQIRPELAESWDISADSLTYTFKLRQGVSWHDGQPFTSEDVKWSFENANKLHPIGRFSFEKVASIEASGPNTLVMRLKEPFAPLLSTLTCADGGAISPKHLAGPDPDVRKNQKLNQTPIGTGPFVFKQWIPGDRIVMDKNPKYWKPGLPYLDQLVAKIIPDSNSMILSLRGGEIQYINFFFVKVEDAVRARTDPKFTVLSGSDAPTFQMVQFNLRKPPFDKLEVRKALLMGMDRDLLLNNVFKGVARLQPNMIDNLLAVAAAPDIDIQKLYPFNIAQANKMLDDAGLPRKADGSRMQFSMIYESDRSEWAATTDVMRATWDQLGVKLTPQPLERAVMLDKVFTKRDFDATLQSYNSRGDPALGATRAFVCEDDKDPQTFGNPTGDCRKDLDQLFNDASKTPDFAKRHEVYLKTQRILTDDLPLLVFMGDQSATLTDKGYDFTAPHNATSQSSGWEYVHKVR